MSDPAADEADALAEAWRSDLYAQLARYLGPGSELTAHTLCDRALRRYAALLSRLQLALSPLGIDERTIFEIAKTLYPMLLDTLADTISVMRARPGSAPRRMQ